MQKAVGFTDSLTNHVTGQTVIKWFLSEKEGHSLESASLLCEADSKATRRDYPPGK